MKLPPELILDQIELGPAENFLYFIGDQNTKEVAVVDPAWDVDYLCAHADKKGYTITDVLLTHCHMDHTNGFDEMVARHQVPAFVSVHENGAYGAVPKYEFMHKVKDGEIITIGNLDIKCIHVPGHSPGCQLFLYKNVCIAGDAIFIDGCGRTDLPGGDVKAMYHSLFDVIMNLPDDTILFPGHNYGPTPYATVGEQKKTNPYLNAENMEDFVVKRMGYAL